MQKPDALTTSDARSSCRPHVPQLFSRQHRLICCIQCFLQLLQRVFNIVSRINARIILRTVNIQRLN